MGKLNQVRVVDEEAASLHRDSQEENPRAQRTVPQFWGKDQRAEATSAYQCILRV
jgi:hypothetical protein